MKHALSYGAGIDSTAMTILLLKKNEPIDFLIFADVGAELPTTYATVEAMRKYVEKFDIPLITVYPAKNRGLQKRCEDRNVIPDRLKRWCTRDVKITPIFKYYRSLKDEVTQYIGIDSTEKKRRRPDPTSEIHNKYPLIELGIDREECERIIEKEGFPKVVKSGCYFCVYNNIERWHFIFNTERKMFDDAIKFEESNKYFPRQTLFPKITLREIGEQFEKGIIPVI